MARKRRRKRHPSSPSPTTSQQRRPQPSTSPQRPSSKKGSPTSLASSFGPVSSYGGDNPRDLSALLATGPSYYPYSLNWTAQRVELVRHFKSYAYLAIDRVATELAGTPPNISYVRDDYRPGDKKKWVTPAVREKALTPLLSHQSLEPAPANHPLVRLLADPNDPDTAYDVWYETILFLYLTGMAYWWLPKNELGLPAALWVLPSHWVTPVTGHNKFIEYYELQPTEGFYLRQQIPADEVICFMKKNPLSKIDGYAPLSASANWISVGESLDVCQKQTYVNGTFPTVAVQFDGSLNDPTEEQLRRIEAKFLVRYVGEMKSNKPLFLPPGVKVQPLIINPNEMVFGDTEERTARKICAAVGVPLLIAGLESATSTAAELAAQASFYRFPINPLRRALAAVLNEKLCPLYTDQEDSAEALRVWWEDGTPLDPTIREKQIQTDLMAGSISPNEVRRLRGREPWPYDWADMPIVPVNMALWEEGTSPTGGTHPTAPQTDPDIPQPHVSEETSLDPTPMSVIFGPPTRNGHTTNRLK